MPRRRRDRRRDAQTEQILDRIDRAIADAERQVQTLRDLRAAIAGDDDDAELVERAREQAAKFRAARRAVRP